MFTCPHCETDALTAFNSYLLIDVRYSEETQFVTFNPCCEKIKIDIQTHGYTEIVGQSVEMTARELTGHDVLSIEDSLFSLMVCRLQIVNPTIVTKQIDKHGNKKCKSPSGWQGDLFNVVNVKHRHHPAPTGWKFGLAVDNGHVRVGVAIVGRPVARCLDDGSTLEVTRVCTFGPDSLRFNSSSKLYAKAAKLAKGLGYDRLVTYTLKNEESGASLIAAGWTPTLISSSGSWDTPSRRRVDKAPTCPKIRWEKGLSKKQKMRIKKDQIYPLAAK